MHYLTTRIIGKNSQKIQQVDRC